MNTQPALSFWQARRDLFGALAIVLTVLALYWPSLYGPFLMDDAVLLTENRLVDDPEGLYRIWFTSDAVDYWPVTNSTFWLEWRAWGYDATGYKMTNIVLHIAGSLLLWMVLRTLKIPGAWLAAMAFAVHPLNVSSVAWVAQRKNLLSLLFFLSSIYSYVRFEDERTIGPRASSRRAGLWYFLSLGAFLLAMLSKASVVMLPFVLGGIVMARRKFVRADLLRLAPFFAVAAVLAVVNIWFRSHGSEVHSLRDADFLQRILGAGGVIWFYLLKTIAPVDQAFLYRPWRIDPADWIWWLPLVAAIATTALLWKSRNTWARPVWYAWLYFCITLLPAMGLIDTGHMKYSLVADHYLHISMIGVLALLAALWHRWNHRAFQSSPNVADFVAAVILGALMLLTWKQCQLYADSVKLYNDSLVRNPNSAPIHNLLGVAYEETGRNEDAARAYIRAIQLNSGEAKYYNNLGAVQILLGLFDEAIVNFERSIKINPNFAPSYRNLAWAQSNKSNWPDAIANCRKSLELDSRDFRTRRLLAIALLENGQAAEAKTEFDVCLQHDPEDAEIMWYLARAHADLGQTAKALQNAELALKLAKATEQPQLTEKIEALIKRLRTKE